MIKRCMFMLLVVVTCTAVLPNKAVLIHAQAATRDVGEFNPNDSIRMKTTELIKTTVETAIAAGAGDEVEALKNALRVVMSLDDSAIRGFIRKSFNNAYDQTANVGNALGTPKDDGGGKYVYMWRWVFIQNFQGGRFGDGALVTSIFQPDNQAFAVTGTLWKTYAHLSGGETMGKPLCASYKVHSGGRDWWVQEFKNGVIVASGNITRAEYREKFYGVGLIFPPKSISFTMLEFE